MDITRRRRRLATILAADVVGYSRLMARDEDATVRTLRAHRAVIDPLIARHDGRIFNTGGDSVLAEFGSPVEAVRCAVALQDELRLRNAELVPDRRLVFRMGINIGDVLVEGDDLLGDGVNIAARLEGLAEPGGICISGSTFEQVKNKLSVGFQDLGPQTVKNIPEPIPAFGITSAPVTLAAREGAPVGPATGSEPARASQRRLLAAAAAAILLLLTAGSAVWYFRGSQPEPQQALPAQVPAPTSTSTMSSAANSIDDMTAGEIEALMTGVRISGRRGSDGQPFEIVLNPDKTASYAFGGSGELAGTTLQETGKWWAEDHRFCMLVPKFANGKAACPRIVKTGDALAAHRRFNGEPLPWTMIK